MTIDGRRRGLILLPLVAVVSQAGCAAMAPRTVELSEARLAALLAGKFPMRRRYLEVFEVTLSDPQLRLMPQTQRLGTRLACALEGPLMGGQPQRGELVLSYGLRYEPADASVRLTSVRVDAFELPGAPPAWRGQLAQLGRVVAESVLHDTPIHHFKPQELARLRARGLQPGALRVTAQGLQLPLEPVAQP